jgi:hypothetical protein
MKKLFALLALSVSMAAHAVTFGPVTFNGPAYAPQAQGTISTVPGFADNYTADIGAQLATYDSQALKLYSTALPGTSTTPPSSMFYVSWDLAGPLASFLTYTAPLVTSAETAAAVQLGVWSLSGITFSIVDNLTLGAAQSLATTWLAASSTDTSATSAFSLKNKDFTNYVYATPVQSPVPEPTTLLLLAAGLILVVMRLRRQG